VILRVVNKYIARHSTPSSIQQSCCTLLRLILSGYVINNFTNSLSAIQRMTELV